MEFYIYHVSKGRGHWKICWFVYSLDERKLKVVEVLKKCNFWVNKKEGSLFPKGWWWEVVQLCGLQFIGQGNTNIKGFFFFFFFDEVYKEELMTLRGYLTGAWCIRGHKVCRWSYEESRCDYDSSMQIKEHGKIDLELYKYHVGKG